MMRLGNPVISVLVACRIACVSSDTDEAYLSCSGGGGEGGNGGGGGGADGTAGVKGGGSGGGGAEGGAAARVSGMNIQRSHQTHQF
eukprot:4230015-Prymnesium_polylepis.2